MQRKIETVTVKGIDINNVIKVKKNNMKKYNIILKVDDQRSLVKIGVCKTYRMREFCNNIMKCAFGSEYIPTSSVSTNCSYKIFIQDDDNIAIIITVKNDKRYKYICSRKVALEFTTTVCKRLKIDINDSKNVQCNSTLSEEDQVEEDVDETTSIIESIKNNKVNPEVIDAVAKSVNATNPMFTQHFPITEELKPEAQETEHEKSLFIFTYVPLDILKVRLSRYVQFSDDIINVIEVNGYWTNNLIKVNMVDKNSFRIFADKNLYPGLFR